MGEVVVVGAGVMGSGIAQTFATAGLSVACADLSSEQLQRAERAVVSGRYGFERAVERGKLTADAARDAQARLRFTDDLDSALRGADLVLEAINEDMRAKTALFAHLGELCDETTVLASNSSGLSIASLGEASGRPDRVLGWHWASPAPVQPFAEIVVTAATSAATLEGVVELARRCGKNPVVVRENPDVWGYVANRVLMAAVSEARRIVDEGLASEQEVDTLLRDGFRWPFGVFGIIQGATEGWGDNRESSLSSMHRETTGHAEGTA